MQIKSSDILWNTAVSGVAGPPGADGADGAQGPPGPACPLTNLTDVTITGAANHDLLVYDTATGEWVNHTADNAGLVDKTTAQNVGGVKTFTSGIKISTAKQVTFEDSLVTETKTLLHTGYGIGMLWGDV